MNATSDFSPNNNNAPSIKDQLKPYLQVWPWIALSAIIAIVLACVYLRYSTNVYEARASVIIKDTRAGGFSELGALGDLGLLGNNFNSVENEIEVLNSKRLMNRVVRELNLTTDYSRQGKVKTSSIYSSSPIVIKRLKADLQELNRSLSFKVKIEDEGGFKLQLPDDNNWKSVAYGSTFYIDEYSFVATPAVRDQFIPEHVEAEEVKKEDAQEILVQVRPLDKVVASLQARLNVAPSHKRGSVVDLTISDAVGERAEDVLNQLIVEYNKDASEDKNLVAQKTAAFIEERIRDYEKELDSVEIGIQSYKDTLGLTDLIAETAIDLEKFERLEAEFISAETQLRLAQDMQAYLNSNLSNDDVISVAGLTDANVESLAASYNELAMSYRRLAQTSTLANPVLQRLDVEMRGVQRAMQEALANYIQGIQTRKTKLKSQLGATGYDISKVPVKEREVRNITRNREVVEAIYLILREKQETTAISLAVTAPKAKIVDAGFAPETPISPKPKIIYLAAALLGVLIPIGGVYLRTLFYNKIESRKDLERNLKDMVILGEIPKLDRDDRDFVQKNDRSVLAEAFRIARTNLYFKLNALEITERAPRVMVTSTIQGEGKTFVAYNLARTLANSEKKVLLVGADIRNPQLYRYLSREDKRKKGVTEFLTGAVEDPMSLISKVPDNEYLDILLSGAIPPNPAELWMKGRTKLLFDTVAQHYDLIIIDTAPTILVTDTFLINDYADLTAYVSRADHTEKPLFEFINETNQSKKLNNMAMILNNVKLTNFGYGNKYGYSYGAKKQSIWKRIVKPLGIK